MTDDVTVAFIVWCYVLDVINDDGLFIDQWTFLFFSYTILNNMNDKRLLKN